MKWILLKANHDTQPPRVTSREFELDEQEAAFAALREWEAGKEDEEEVVLFGANSLDVLRRTHSRYFYTPEQIMENLRTSLRKRYVLPETTKTS